MAEIRQLADMADEQERMAILEQIVLQLSFRERNALVQIVSKCNDILTALPVELILDILSYLPIQEVWSLQLVCRQWRSVLSSEHILRSVLSRWESHDPTDSASETCLTEDIRSKIRRMQAMRLGRPFASRLFTDHIKSSPGVLRTQANRSFALKGRRLAYIRSLHNGGDSVVVLDLLSNKELNFCGAARERVMSIACTSNIIAFVTYSGKLYVPDLADPTSLLKAVQLPSASLTAFNGDDNVVCLALKGKTAASFTLAIYDCTVGVLRAFELSSREITVANTTAHVSPKALLVDAKSAVVDVFSQLCLISGAYGSREDVFVEHRRYSFSGQHVSSSAWQRLGTPRATKVPFELGDPHSTGEPGRFILRTKLLQSSLASDWSASPRVPPPLSLLVFDSKNAMLSEHIFSNELQRPHMQHLGDYTSIMLWKDVEIRAVGNLLFTSTENDPSKWFVAGRYRLRNAINMIKLSGVSSRSHLRYDDSSYSLLVNDSFIVGVEQTPSTEDWQSCIKIFCFDENLQWAGARDMRLWELDGAQVCKFGNWDGTVPKLPR